MKMKAAILVCMLLMSGLIVGTGVQAVPYSGTIVFSDLSGNVQDYFDPADWVVFEVTVLDDGVPLQGQTVQVVIVGDGILGEVFNTTYTTNSYGQFTGDHSDDSWWTREVGFYTMFVNYTDALVVSDTFRIYNAVPWSATGYSSFFDEWSWSATNEAMDKFTEDQRVGLVFHALDQYGNPYDGSSGDVWYEITKNYVYITSGNLNTNNSGGAQASFDPDNENEDQFGRYLVTIFNDAVPPQEIGSFQFTVVLPNRAAVTLSHYGDERAVFKEGETVGYEIALFHQNTLPYDSNNYAARVLLLKEGTEDPLRNRTLNTDTDGLAEDTFFYSLGYGEDVRGTYTVEVYNYTWHLIGSAMFMVIEIEIGILPEKAAYAQGDIVTFTVTTTLEEAYRVVISDDAGVTLPTASWNVPAGTSDWWHDYTFPETLPDGQYSVDVYMDALLLTTRTFTLKKISLEIMLSQSSFVPGQTGTLFWRAVNNHDGGPITVTGDSLLHYMDEDWDYINKDLSAISGSSGSFAFTVPRDAMIGYSAQIEIDAEDTAGHSDEAWESFNVRSLNVDLDTDRNTYLPGDTVFITVRSTAGASSPVPNVDVKLTVQRDGTTVGSSWTVRTNNAGTFSTTFQIPASAAKGVWVIIINATYSAYNEITYDGTEGFDLMTDPVVSMTLLQEKDRYTPGETVNVIYRILRDGVEVTGARVTFEAWMQQTGQINIALGFGNSGLITFTLPNNMEGSLYINAVAITSDGYQAGDGLGPITVASGQLALMTDRSVYLPGELITWNYVLSGDVASSALYRITDPDGFLLAQGVPENGTFTFQLPTDHAVNPTARIYITGASKSYFATSTANVYSGYILEFRILSNSYSPGDIMKINYTIKKVGDVPDSVNGFQITFSMVGEHSQTVWVAEPFGVLEYLISENTTDGRHMVTVTLNGSPATFNDVQAVIIDSNAGELAHGTILGMNSSGFLALIFAIVALIIAIIGVVMWRKSVAAKQNVPPTPPAQPAEINPPAPEPVHGTSYQYPPEPPQEPAGAGGYGDYPPPPQE